MELETIGLILAAIYIVMHQIKNVMIEFKNGNGTVKSKAEYITRALCQKMIAEEYDSIKKGVDAKVGYVTRPPDPIKEAKGILIQKGAEWLENTAIKAGAKHTEVGKKAIGVGITPEDMVEMNRIYKGIKSKKDQDYLKSIVSKLVPSAESVVSES